LFQSWANRRLKFRSIFVPVYALKTYRVLDLRLHSLLTFTLNELDC
jgi:hypothetical protein